MNEKYTIDQPTYKGYSLLVYEKYPSVFVGKATGQRDIGCYGQRTEQEAVEELKRLIDKTEEEERVPGLGAFDRDWSGLKFKDRRRK